ATEGRRLDGAIDDATAWNLVRALPRGPAPRGGAVEVGTGAGPGPRLRVDSAGRWRTSAPVDASARDLLDLFLPRQVRGSWVVAQLGQSLDGRIATHTGHSHYVTGHED